jgi:hypothetical protein
MKGWLSLMSETLAQKEGLRAKATAFVVSALTLLTIMSLSLAVEVQADTLLSGIERAEDGGYSLIAPIGFQTRARLSSRYRRRSRKRRRRNVYSAGRASMTEKVAAGSWGGEHIALQVRENSASIEFDCAHGTIDQQLSTDAGGHFDVTGVYVREHGGPARQGEEPDTHPARYIGRTSGKRMTMTVTLTDSNRTIGTFELELGREPMVTKCL